MEIKAVQNSQSFQGRFRVAENINPKAKANFYKIMDDIDLCEKPYDIIVKKHPENQNFLTITAQNIRKPSENYSIWIHHFMERLPSLRDAVKTTIKGYEEQFDRFI